MSATIPRINSVALPKVMLSRPPAVDPTCFVNSLVAKLKSKARGIKAKKFVVNITAEDQLRKSDRSANGTKTNRTLM